MTTNTLVADAVQGYRIEHAYGPLRQAAQAYLRQWHSLASDGNQGYMFAVVADAGDVAGACLVGNAVSAAQERDLVPRAGNETIVGACLVGESSAPDIAADLVAPGPAVRIPQVKRSHILDDVPTTAVCERKLLRRSIPHVTDLAGGPVLFVSYADPSAVDARTDEARPLLGGCYLAAGFFYVGMTGPRRVVLDHQGKWRSTKQGRVTRTSSTLPRVGTSIQGEIVTQDWTLFTALPARIWIAVATPRTYTRTQAAVAWRRIWHQLNPERRVAAKLWVDEVQWRRDLRGGIVPLGEPKPAHHRAHDRFQPGLWPGARITRTAAPAWPGFVWNATLVFAEDIAGETVARRHYAPSKKGPIS